jgi:hypothetical protein
MPEAWSPAAHLVTLSCGEVWARTNGENVHIPGALHGEMVLEFDSVDGDVFLTATDLHTLLDALKTRARVA